VDRDGCFAEYVAVPEKVLWHTDRDKLPPEIATLQEPFGNAVFSALANDLTGQSVGVLGCGPIGLFSIAIAKASGASRVVASDVNDYRLDLARKMGADEVFKPTEGRGVQGRAPGWLRQPVRHTFQARSDRRGRGHDFQKPDGSGPQRQAHIRDLVQDPIAIGDRGS
jgi:threonine dehydrogenase-like Zn-dependent dehydrogenase